jgi:uroporphyrinogen III methyltransferase / synthase
MLTRGTVYLVGAGPGDPGLITRRGLDVLRQADVVVYDRLASPELLLEARPEARLIYVGKSPERHALTQDEINEVLAQEGGAGNTVCRLKGGDPFLFGRGGEEADHLRERSVPFVVVPGVTSAISAPAYAGIPVTDRRAASSVAIATGHEEADKEEGRVDWTALATAADTLVVLMGMRHLREIAAELIAGGRPATTPAAVVQWGTTGRQRVVYADLDGIADEVKRQAITHPAILVVGEVVSLSHGIQWFTGGALRGLRVLVTRPRQQASALAELLREHGAEPVIASVIRVEPVPIPAERLRELSGRPWDWVLFTSANGVTALREHLLQADLDWRALAGARLGAIGPGTAAAIRGQGLRVDFVPSRAIAESLAEELPEIQPGARVLLARAEEARDVLPQRIAERGGEVEVLTTYRTVPDARGLELLRTVLEEGDLDVITLTSSSAARNLVEAAGVEALKAYPVACIGPITADTAREMGLDVAAEATEHTLPGLIAALTTWAGARGGEPEGSRK